MRTYFFRIVLIILFAAVSQDIKAQDEYIHSLGIRGGQLTGITYKRFFFPPNGVLEGIVGVNFNYDNERLISLTGLYEYHVFINYRINVYAGAGLSLAANANNFEMTGETIFGIEYTVETFPINFSLNYKPGYRLFEKRFIVNEFALSARYILD